MKIEGAKTAMSAIKASGIQDMVMVFFFPVFFSIVPFTPVKIHNDVSTKKPLRLRRQ